MAVLVVVLAFSDLVASQQLIDQRTYRLSLPAKIWSLDVSAPNFDVSHEVVKANTYLFFAYRSSVKGSSNHAGSLIIHMEPAMTAGDAVAFRDFDKKRLSKIASVGSTKAAERNSIPMLRYSRSSTRTIAGYFVKDDTWIKVEVGFGDINKNDEDFFDLLVDSIKFVDNSTPVSSFDYYHTGRTFYLQNEYEKAIEPFAVALTLERRNPSLEKGTLRQLITELSDAYGALRRLSEFKRVLDYGLEKFPSYYVFHWALARYHASLGDLDKTLAALEQAFANNPKTQPSPMLTQTPPDPFSDPIFQRFRKDEKFRKAVKEMQKKWMKIDKAQI